MAFRQDQAVRTFCRAGVRHNDLCHLLHGSSRSVDPGTLFMVREGSQPAGMEGKESRPYQVESHERAMGRCVEHAIGITTCTDLIA